MGGGGLKNLLGKTPDKFKPHKPGDLNWIAISFPDWYIAKLKPKLSLSVFLFSPTHPPTPPPGKVAKLDNSN